MLDCDRVAARYSGWPFLAVTRSARTGFCHLRWTYAEGALMRVEWFVKQNQQGTYDVYKDGALLHQRIPYEKLEDAMNVHHVRGDYWRDLRKQLETKREGTVVVDPSPPGDFRVA
jgi:hypothetical protein